MPAPRPLPRSLIPIPGESLPGFLLRLSCRLNQPPAKIAKLTGLAPGGASGARIPVILLAGVPETDSSTFTRMTRLTGAQAAQLGTGTWQERYPPVIASPESKARGARRLDGRLILAPATRYCPECLAGDGSAIQEAFGGPWLKAWHLPVVFACPAHRRLLEHLCPECGQVIRGRRPGRNAALLPAMLASGLHPAQCRTEIAQGTGTASALLRDPARPGQPAPPGRPRTDRPPGQDPRPPRSGRPRRHAQRGNAGTAGQLLLRPPGTRAPGLLHLAGNPAPEPGRGRRVGHRPAHRLAPGTGCRPACRIPGGRIPHQGRLHLPTRGCRRQRRAREH